MLSLGSLLARAQRYLGRKKKIDKIGQNFSVGNMSSWFFYLRRWALQQMCLCETLYTCDEDRLSLSSCFDHHSYDRYCKRPQESKDMAPRTMVICLGRLLLQLKWYKYLLYSHRSCSSRYSRHHSPLPTRR